MLNRKTHTLYLCLILLLAAKRSDGQNLVAGPAVLYSTNENLPITDTTRFFKIDDVEIEGNKHTKEKVIFRELSFQIGETYALSDLIHKCGQARVQLLNTSLFLSVSVSIKSTKDSNAVVLVTVRERAYFIPVPFVDIVGTSYSHWVKEEKMNLNKVKYGIKLNHKNISGLNDRLSLNLTGGYSKEVSLNYEGLPLDHDLKWMFSFSFDKGQQRDLVYSTQNNKSVSLHSDNEFLYSYTNGNVSLSYRPAIKTKHIFGIAYHSEIFADTIASLNKSYLFAQNEVRYPELYYTMQYTDVDFVPYPTRGYASEVQFSKKGFKQPVNVWQLTTKTTAYYPLSTKNFLRFMAGTSVKLPFHQPFTQQQFIGSNDMEIQGYESYVIDGVAGGYLKASFHQRILDRNYSIKLKHFPRLSLIPVKVYAKVFGNTGYIYNPEPGTNFLNNKMLYSGGVGLDIVLFYDVTFRFEYSFNHIGENGLYLHDKNQW